MDSKLLEKQDGHRDESAVLKEHLTNYENAALAHTEAMLNPDHRKANRNHKIIMDAVAYLKDHGELLQLSQFLSHPSDGVRAWAATHLLPTELNAYAVSVLEEVAAGTGFVALDAEMVLSEWAKGNLRP